MWSKTEGSDCRLYMNTERSERTGSHDAVHCDIATWWHDDALPLTAVPGRQWVFKIDLLAANGSIFS